MGWIIGTDEAGYGPNLGPLVVAATLWRVPDREIDLYKTLSRAVTARVVSRRRAVASSFAASGDAPRRARPARLCIADSKTLYARDAGAADVGALELGVLAVWRTLGAAAANARQFVAALDGGFGSRELDEPWRALRELELPVQACPNAVACQAQRFSRVAASVDVRCEAIAVRVVLPALFNREVASDENKATLLSRSTLGLVRPWLDQLDGPVLVTCDKHGGRNYYAAFVQELADEHWVHILEEQSRISRYQWQTRDANIELRFVVRGERFLQTALASMTAKYVRELFMNAWNGFWRQHLPGLRPTAGYPGDAQRFRREIADVQAALGISDESIWRCR